MSNPGNPNAEIKPLVVPGTSGSRIRISSRLLSSLDWSTGVAQFSCIGLFRRPGEFLIAPADLVDEDGEHPFGSALRFMEIGPDTKIVPLGEIPPARVITAPHRIFRFDATWVGDKKMQLDLKVGVEVMRRLGWKRGKETSVFPAVWGAILLLFADFRFSEIQTEDFTDGHLQP